jgi:hypothetical protein
MKRRSLLKSGIYITGYSFLVGSTLSTFTSCREENKSLDGWNPEFLTVQEAELVAEIAEAIIPKTDTPGAKDALVHQFIDENVKLNLNSEQQRLFREGLKSFDQKAEKLFNKKFISLTEDEKIDLLNGMEEEAKTFENKNEPHIFSVLKDMTKFGYCTSEVGSKEFLIFDQIPGVYQGCIDYSEVGGTWAI